MQGCGAVDGPLSVLQPAGPGAASIATVWWAMFWGGMALLGFMTALGLLAVLRRRDGAALAADAPVRRRLWLVGGGLVLPTVVLTALLAWGISAGHALLALPLAEPPFTVEVTARQWQWDVHYPAQQGRGAQAGPVNRIDIPAGVPVDVRVATADVIHSFWVPRLGGKIDAIPGRVNTLRLQADAPGVYRGLCAEYCGTGHAHMPLEVHAHPAADLARVLADRAAP